MSKDILNSIGKRIGDITDLPNDLRKQIIASNLDELEEKIVGTMRIRYDGVANIDEIIVGLYRDYKYITKERRLLGTKLYRMRRSGIIQVIPNIRGAYKVK